MFRYRRRPDPKSQQWQGIPKRIVKEFLKRPRDDLRKWKDLTEDELDVLAAELPVKPPIWSSLRIHQKVCLLIGAKYRRAAFFLDTGAGKTYLSVALARYFRRLEGTGKFIVLVPNRINLFEWQRQIAKHSPSTSITVLVGSSEDKWKALEENDSLLNVVTYMGLVHMVCEAVAEKKKNKNRKTKLEPAPRLLARLKRAVEGAILDESTAIGNHASLPFRVARQVSKTADVFFELTGTPFGRDPQPLWSQMFLVDGGQSLGPTLGLFRAAFYNTKINYFGGAEHTFDKSKEVELNRVIAHRSIRYEADEADLPEVVPIPRMVPPPLDADAYIKKLKAELAASRGNYIETKNSFTRLRQLSSGFIGFKNDETGERAQYEFEDKPKLEALLDIVLSIRPDYKIVIAYDFIKSGLIISKALKEEGVEHVLVSGKTKHPEAEMQKFIEDKRCQAFVLNTVGAYGLNLQMARYLIFYESPVPVIIRKQMERRVERQGSKYKRVFMYDLMTQGTYDEKILRFHKEGRDLFKAIINGERDGLI